MTPTDTPDPIATNWLDRLDDPDSDAWSNLDQLCADLDADHPIRLTVDFLDPESDPTERRNASTPTLAYYAERVPTEPGAFARCVLELARSPFADTEQPVRRRVRECKRFISNHSQLSALAVAYDVDAWRWVPSVHDQGGRDFYNAYRQVLGDADEATADPWTREILATLIELEIDLLASRRHILAFGYSVEHLLNLLENCPIPGRRASALWRLGRHFVAIDEDVQAAEALAEAERELPEDLDLGLRLDIWHLRAFAEAAQKNYDEAARFLDLSAPLMDRWGYKGILAQRLHLLGHLAQLAGHHEEAEACWMQSIELSSQLGRHSDMWQTTAALERLRAERGPAE
ncbi:MAG: tetratricopeptide repeat protein [Acidobacteriota bacterium]